MRIATSLLLVLLSTLTYAQPSFDCDILDAFDSTKVSFNAKEIPRKVLKLYWKKYGKTGVSKLDRMKSGKLNIANPNEEWNNSGIIYEDDKNAQLIYWGEDDEKGFVFLKTGGLGILITCIIYDLKNDIIENVPINNPTISALPLTASIVELRKEIEEHITCTGAELD